MAGDINTLVRPALEARLEAGESLDGVVIATQRKTFSGRMVALGVATRPGTGGRVIFQPLTRKAEPDGEATSFTVDELRSAWAGTAGSEWWNTEWPVTDAALTMRLKLTNGEKLTLDLMRGGDGMLGRLGGGAEQEQGLEALAAWLRGPS
jgi:hypothetical protein